MGVGVEVLRMKGLSVLGCSRAAARINILSSFGEQHREVLPVFEGVGARVYFNVYVDSLRIRLENTTN